MRRLTFAAFAATVIGCASMAPPPGGPDDPHPPHVLSFTPADSAMDPTIKSITVQFDKVIAEPPRSGRGGGPQGLAQFVLLSPDAGNLKVEWHRDHITITPAKGFRRDVTYRVTLLPGITDLRGHRTPAPTSWLFSTGNFIATLQLPGRVFDWVAQTPATNAIIQATVRLSATDSLVYLGAPDSTGAFKLGPMNGGTYEVRGFIDLNANQRRDSAEKESGLVRYSVDNSQTVLELLAIERDSLPPDIANVEVIDSVSVRVHFDRALDPFQQLQPALVRVQRTDSTELVVQELVTEADDAARRRAIAQAVADSIIKTRADSIAAANPGQPRPAPPPAPPPVTAPTRIIPKPSAPPPTSTIVIHLSPANRIAADEIVRITTRGFRGIVGLSKTATTTAKRAK